MRARPSVVVFSLVALACGGGDAPRVHVAVQGSEFDRGGTGTIAEVLVPFTVTNRGERTAFVPACGDRPIVSVERGTGTGWEQYSGSGCLDTSLQTPIQLRSGQSVSSSYPLYEAGTYRIRVSYAPTATISERTETAASGSFVVR